jgi:hypothetical protein
MEISMSYRRNSVEREFYASARIPKWFLVLLLMLLGCLHSDQSTAGNRPTFPDSGKAARAGRGTHIRPSLAQMSRPIPSLPR